MASSSQDRSLAQIVRRSPALDASERRRWLAVLPHLTAEDQQRLREILLESAQDAPPPSPPASGAGEEGRP